MNNEKENEGWGEDFSAEGGANIMWRFLSKHLLLVEGGVMCLTATQ